jgi:hypothetical protein
MKRRPLLVWGAMAALALAACSHTPPAAAQPRYTVSAAQLEQVLAERFPRRLAAAGVIELQLRTPRLRFLPEQNRLASELPIDASGPALGRPLSGSVDLDFALRYEPSDQTLRAHQIRIQAVRLPSLAPEAQLLLDAYARAAAERALFEVVLHRLEPKDLALAHTMGFEPGPITVVADGLVIGFVLRESR